MFSSSGEREHSDVVFAHVVELILLGLLVGFLGRLIHPGRHRMGLPMTIAIGVGSVLIAGLLIGGLLGFVLAVVIGVALVALWSEARRRRRPRWFRALRF